MQIAAGLQRSDLRTLYGFQDRLLEWTARMRQLGQRRAELLDPTLAVLP